VSDQWILVRPAMGVARLTGLIPSGLPVRSRRLDDVLGRATGRVDLAALCDELDVFATEQPDTIDRLTPSMIRLSIAAADEALWARDWDRAERLVRRGRGWDPANLSLLVKSGQALHGLGRHAEATDHWRSAIDAARAAELWSPMLWLLTARSLIEQHDDRAAVVLLDELCDRSDQDGIRRLRSSVAQRIHQARPR
jgi:predicted Zn-dependent protease